MPEVRPRQILFLHEHRMQILRRRHVLVRRELRGVRQTVGLPLLQPKDVLRVQQTRSEVRVLQHRSRQSTLWAMSIRNERAARQKLC